MDTWVKGNIRAVKMDWNSRVNLVRYGFGLGWVKIFLTNFNMG